MKDFKTYLFICTFVAIATLIAGFFLGRRDAQAPPIRTQTDTLVIRDTVSVEKPVPVAVTLMDTILVPVADTIVLHDTTFVVLTREQKYYRGDRYEAWVSGYQPTLDKFNVFTEDRTITNTVYVRQPYSHQIGFFAQAAYCGRFITPVGVKYEYAGKRWTAGASIGYEPINRNAFIGLDARFNLFRW